MNDLTEILMNLTGDEVTVPKEAIIALLQEVSRLEVMLVCERAKAIVLVDKLEQCSATRTEELDAAYRVSLDHLRVVHDFYHDQLNAVQRVLSGGQT